MFVLPFLNNLKDQDPSYKTDLDFWDCFVRGKTPSYKRRNMVYVFFTYETEFVLFLAVLENSVSHELRHSDATLKVMSEL